jgi:hypothetical protein
MRGRARRCGEGDAGRRHDALERWDEQGSRDGEATLDEQNERGTLGRVLGTTPPSESERCMLVMLGYHQGCMSVWLETVLRNLSGTAGGDDVLSPTRAA